MNCKICHVPDPGNHYTQNCCRACAAFFRRTTQLKLRYRCKKVGNCEITTKNRFFCRYCRLKRCIEAGMTNLEDPNLSVSFFLDSSGKDYIGIDDNLPSIEEVDFYSVENVIKNGNFMTKYNELISSIFSKAPDKKSYPFVLSPHQQVAAAYTNFKNKFPKKKLQVLFTVDMGKQIVEGFRACQFVAEMLMEIEDFVKLPLEDKLMLFQQVGIPFLQLHRAKTCVDILGDDLNGTRVVEMCGNIFDLQNFTYDTSVAGSSQMDLEIMLQSEQEVVNEYLAKFKKLKPDDFEFIYLATFAIFKIKDEEKFSPKTLQLIDEVQERLTEELFFYYKFEKKISNFASRIYKMRNLFSTIEKMEKVRETDNQMIATFEMFSLEDN